MPKSNIIMSNDDDKKVDGETRGKTSSPRIPNEVTTNLIADLTALPDTLQSFGAGMDTGLMLLANDVQRSAGKGLDKLGMNKLSRILLEDADSFEKSELESNKPYEQSSPKANQLGKMLGDGIVAYGIARAGGLGVTAMGARTAAAGFPVAGERLGKLGASIGSGGISNNLGMAAAGGAINGGLYGALSSQGDWPTIATDAALGAVAGPVLSGGVGRSKQAVIDVIQGKHPTPPINPNPGEKVLTTSREQGYIVPPSMDPEAGMVKRLLNSYSGKIQTEQHFSQANQEVSNMLAKKALGLPVGTQLSREALAELRKKLFAQGYDPVKSLGKVEADDVYREELNAINGSYRNSANSFPLYADHPIKQFVESLNVPEFVSEDALDTIRNLRQDAKKSFATRDNALGQAQLAASRALESQLERALAQKGPASQKILEGYKNARREIAKTHSVESALNPSSGNISAPKLAAQLNKGVPLSDELKVIAHFANTYPKAAAHQLTPLANSPLDVAFGSTTLKALGLATGRPLVRKYLMAKGGVQRALPEVSEIERLGGLAVTPRPDRSKSDQDVKVKSESLSRYEEEADKDRQRIFDLIENAKKRKADSDLE